MAVAKVTLNGVTLMDVTDATASGSEILSNYNAYVHDGTKVSGSYVPPTPQMQTKTATYTPTESQQTATITADSGYDGLSEVDVTVNAISSTYVGTGITRRSSTDLTASGATVTVPSGYYAEQASKAVASGTAGTPTATKGTVSNHSISVTPSVTNTAGYISGGTKTGTAVTVSASELVSGNLAIAENGTNIDCSTYSTVSVNVSGGGSATIDTKTMTVSTVASSISFTGLSGTPKAFWVRCTTTLTRSSSYREYYVATMRYNGTNTTGNRWYRYNGQVSNITSGYSFSYSSGTLTLSSSGNQSTSPGAFYNGSYELVYVY